MPNAPASFGVRPVTHTPQHTKSETSFNDLKTNTTSPPSVPLTYGFPVRDKIATKIKNHKNIQKLLKQMRLYTSLFLPVATWIVHRTMVIDRVRLFGNVGSILYIITNGVTVVIVLISILFNVSETVL